MSFRYTVGEAAPRAALGSEAPSCACGARSYREVMSGTYRRGAKPAFRFSVIECVECGLRRSWPVPSPLVYEQGDAHSSARPSETSVWSDAIVRDVKSFVREGRLLDVGCNNGDTVAVALRAGFDAEGIDIDPAAIAIGEAAGLPVRVAQLEEVEGVFDAILLNHVFEHVVDLRSALASIANALAPDGRCFVYVPNHRGLVARIMRENWSGWLPNEHVWHFSPATFRSVVAASALEIRRLTTKGVIEPVQGNHELAKRLVVGFSRAVSWGDQIEAVLARADEAVLARADECVQAREERHAR
jgi:2-polyprenyl-3-methyl-5-hydroxy-6-metoxy-1,4-benzoquinol methylase